MPKEKIPSHTDEEPRKGEHGPRTPYPVDYPGIRDQPGTTPDYVPPTPSEPPGSM